ncbi:MAG: helix-turn-helix domain-containing protein [Nanoarchaeota archaeon]
MNEEEQFLSLLESIGLTKTEALIYLTLVRKGSLSGYRLSKEAGLYKANTYMALESLVKKNLVFKKEINNKLFFESTPPEDILKSLELQKEKVQAVIPFIRRHFREEMEEVSVFTGLDAFFQMFYSLLDQNQAIYVFDIPSYVPDIVKNHINQFHKIRIKKKIPMYHIYDYDAKDRISLLKKMKYTFAKQGAKDRLSLTSTFVCGNTTLILNWKKEIKTVRIIDKDVAETYRHQFDILWKIK